MSDQIFKYLSALRSQLAGPRPGLKAHTRLAPVDRPLVPAEGVTPRESAVLVLLFLKAGDLHVLLTQRAEYEGVHSAQVGFPGGKCERQDINIVDTALREAREELGLDSASVMIAGQLTDLYITPSNYRVHPVVACVNELPGLIPDEREVAEVFSVPVSELGPQYVQVRTVTHSSGLKIKTPCYEAEGKIVWGATAMILSELFEIHSQVTSSGNLS